MDVVDGIQNGAILKCPNCPRTFESIEPGVAQALLTNHKNRGCDG